MRDVVMTAVRPLLLGGGRVARETAVRFFMEYRVFSVLLDRKRPLFSLFTSFTQLPDTRSDEFLLMSLERLGDELSDVTCLVIPCNEEFEAFVKRNRERLETRFILRSPELACEVCPVKGSVRKD